MQISSFPQEVPMLKKTHYLFHFQPSASSFYVSLNLRIPFAGTEIADTTSRACMKGQGVASSRLRITGSLWTPHPSRRSGLPSSPTRTTTPTRALFIALFPSSGLVWRSCGGGLCGGLKEECSVRFLKWNVWFVLYVGVLWDHACGHCNTTYLQFVLVVEYFGFKSSLIINLKEAFLFCNIMIF